MSQNNYNSALKNAHSPDLTHGFFTDSGVGTAIDNATLGNLDYQRELAQMEMQNAFNSWQTDLSWNRQKENAQSQYQWAVDDLRKAGLNPFLAYSNGGNQVGTVPTATSGYMSSQNKGKQVSSLLGGIFATLLGSAFKVATTSMINEGQMAIQLERAKTSKELSMINNVLKSKNIDNSSNYLSEEKKRSNYEYAEKIKKAIVKRNDYYSKHKVWKDLDDFMD